MTTCSQHSSLQRPDYGVWTMKGLLGFSPDCGSSQSVPCIRHHQYYSPTTACSSPLAAVTTRIRGRQQEEETFVSCCYETMPMYCVMRQVVPGPDIRYGHREQSPGGDNGKAPPHQAAGSLLTFSADTGRGMGGELEQVPSQRQRKLSRSIVKTFDISASLQLPHPVIRGRGVETLSSAI